MPDDEYGLTRPEEKKVAPPPEPKQTELFNGEVAPPEYVPRDNRPRDQYGAIPSLMRDYSNPNEWVGPPKYREEPEPPETLEQAFARIHRGEGRGVKFIAWKDNAPPAEPDGSGLGNVGYSSFARPRNQ